MIKDLYSMSQTPLHPIRLDLTPEQNMLATINAVAIEPLTYEDFTLGKPTPHQDTNPFYNTAITLTAKGTKYRGLDTQYYHRVDVGNKGVADTDGTKYVGKAIKTTQTTLQGILTDICNVLSLMPSEFTITSVSGNAKYNYRITAKPNSLLYINSVCVKVQNNTATGTVLNTVDGFYPVDVTVQHEANISGTVHTVGVYNV